MAPHDQRQISSGPVTTDMWMKSSGSTKGNDDALSLMDLTWIMGPPMALKAAMTLGVPKILAQHSRPLTAEEILLEIPGCKDKHDKLAAENLRSILSILVQNDVFGDESSDESESSPRYCLTPMSRLLVDAPESTVLCDFYMQHQEKVMRAWLHLHEAVLDSGARPFNVANGMTLWEAFAQDQQLSSLFHNAFSASVHEHTSTFLQYYDRFEGIQTLVDVGGSRGALVGAIVQANPHIRGINYDLPNIIASAPNVPGVENVAGDFFHSVPNGDAILMKSILHDWNDEQCIKILENCRKALPPSGKVIIFEQVLLPPTNRSSKARVGHKLNLAMLATCDGQERYAEDWAKLISVAGFPRQRIINIPSSFYDIIEASMS